MRLRLLKLLPLLLIAIAGLALLTAESCNGGQDDLREQRQSSLNTRAGAFTRAEALYPAPRTENFPLRRDLVKFTEREDLLNHPWYVYILSDVGTVLGYYVADGVPVNSCTFLSSTEDVDSTDNGKVVLTAPSLDGIFYGGGGAAAGCDEWFFFDASTDAMIKIRGVKFFVADQPLKLQAEPIEVASVPPQQ